MKKVIIWIFIGMVWSANAQNSTGIFSKDPIINLENWQKKRIYFGFYLGFSSFDYKFDYYNPTNVISTTQGTMEIPSDIQVEKTVGFNVGLVSNLRLMEYLDLRFEPGLYYGSKTLHYAPANDLPRSGDQIRELNSTYINFPLLLKFSALRTGNVRPYLLGGASTNLNLSSNAKSPDDNLLGKFRVKSWTYNYELGFGIDIFSEYFIFSPSIRGQFGIGDELIRDNSPNSPWTSNIESMKSRGILVNFTFH